MSGRTGNSSVAGAVDVVVAGASNKAQLAFIAHDLMGEDAVFKRLWGGAKARHYPMSAAGAVIAGPCVVYGVKVISGSAVTCGYYDALTNTGSNFGPAGTLVNGTTYMLADGVGVEFASGLYANLGGTTPVVEFLAAAA